MQLEKTTYTLASPLVIGRISAGNNLYIKSDQLVNDKSIIKSRNDSYLHSKNITAISQKLGEKSAWVAMHNALDKRANYVPQVCFFHPVAADSSFIVKDSLFFSR